MIVKIVNFKQFRFKPIDVFQQFFNFSELFLVVHLLKCVWQVAHSIHRILKRNVLSPPLVLVIEPCRLTVMTQLNPSNEIPQ